MSINYNIFWTSVLWNVDILFIPLFSLLALRDSQFTQSCCWKSLCLVVSIIWHYSLWFSSASSQDSEKHGLRKTSRLHSLMSCFNLWYDEAVSCSSQFRYVWTGLTDLCMNCITILPHWQSQFMSGKCWEASWSAIELIYFYI